MGMMSLRRRVMGGKKNLPYDAEIEFLESEKDGRIAQWIDTGINPKNYPRVVADVVIVGGGDQDLWGNSNNSSFGNSCFIANVYSYGLYYYRYGSINYVSMGSIGRDRHVVETDHRLIIDGVLIKEIPFNFVPNASQENIWIFNAARNQIPATMRLYTFKLYDAGELVREYIPVRVGTTGYLYDKVSGELFGNQGTGNFILGPDKN